jgi:hypothetical protein
VKILACSRWIDAFSASELLRVMFLNCLFSAPELPWVMPTCHVLWIAVLVHLNCPSQVTELHRCCAWTSWSSAGLYFPRLCVWTFRSCGLELFELVQLNCLKSRTVVEFLNCLVSALELPEDPPTYTSLVSVPELLIVASLNFLRYTVELLWLVYCVKFFKLSLATACTSLISPPELPRVAYLNCLVKRT